MEQATVPAPGWLDGAVLVGQLSGDALPQIVEMTHELTLGARWRPRSWPKRLSCWRSHRSSSQSTSWRRRCPGSCRSELGGSRTRSGEDLVLVRWYGHNLTSSPS
jgi:hypothetical protein